MYETLVSVVLPVYNGERFLGAAIETLLVQTLADFEVILVDDGSTHPSAEIYNSYKAKDAWIRVIRQGHNTGLVAALNTGLTCASGRYIARLDHDDIALPHRLETQVKVLSNEEDVAFVGSTMIAVDETGQTIGYLWHPETPDQIRFGLCLENEIGHPTVMYKEMSSKGMACGTTTHIRRQEITLCGRSRVGLRGSTTSASRW